MATRAEQRLAAIEARLEALDEVEEDASPSGEYRDLEARYREAQDDILAETLAKGVG